MTFKIKGLILGVLILLIAISFVGIKFFKKENPVKVGDVKIEEEKNQITMKDFDKYVAEKNPRIPEYTLPLKTSEIVNFKDIQSIINVSKSASSLLTKNGFVVVPNTVFKDLKLGYGPEVLASSYFEKYYEYLHDKVDQFTEYNDDYEIPPVTTKHLPIFISADSALHYFHLIFDTTLIKLETNIFYDYLWDISKGLFDKSLLEYNTTKDPVIKEAAKRNVAYFSVVLNLLGVEDSKSFYETSSYKEYFKENGWTVLFSASSCANRNVQEKMGSRYTEVLEDLYGLLGSGDDSESNINIIISSAFKKYNLNSSADLIQMKELQSSCETIVKNAMQSNNPMELISKTDKYTFNTPDFVKSIVDKELNNIEKHKGWDKSPLFVYQEDYSQYVPRAHYTKSDKLKKYFKAMMWYGRMTFLAHGDSKQKDGTSLCSENGILSVYDAKIQTIESSLINFYLSGDITLKKKLMNMTEITDFLVGGSDDIGVNDYLAIMNKYVKSSSDIVKNNELIQKDIINLSDKSKIYGGLGGCMLDVSKNTELNDQAVGILKATKGFRLFGQKFVPDSYWMSQIVSPYSGVYNGGEKKPFTWVQTQTGKEVKGFPRGLDVMSILGSERADEIIKEIKDDNYTEYEKQIEVYKSEVKKFAITDWYKTIYNSWLYALTALLDNFAKGYPTFMLTKAYQDKSLTTALASWTQLRHDTLLYVKQSYTMAEKGGGPPEPVIVGYVEPIPELYIRLFKSSLIFQDKLQKIAEKDNNYISILSEDFGFLNDILENLIVISNKELRHEALTEEEYDFIDNFADTSKRLITLLASQPGGGDVIDIGEIMNAIMVADVHTEGNTGQALEEGVGKIRTGLFVYRAPQNNNLVLGIGPIFSYYEFKQPMDNRLTDEAWRNMILHSNKQPNKPEWIDSFYTKN